MNKMMSVVNKTIHYFNLSFGIGLVLLLSLTVGRIFFGDQIHLDSLISQSSLENEVRTKRVPSQENSTDTMATDTNILGNVGLSSEQMATVAKHIYHLGMSMDEKFEVGDGLSLATYVLRYMAEIGEYELGQKDILILVDAFEKLGEMEVGPQVEAILAQIKKIRFGRREGKLFTQLFALNPDRGIVIPINERSEEDRGLLQIVSRLTAALA